MACSPRSPRPRTSRSPCSSRVSRRDDIRTPALDAPCERVGVEDPVNRLVEEVSGGQQQRIAVARGLVAAGGPAPRRRADRGARRGHPRRGRRDAARRGAARRHRRRRHPRPRGRGRSATRSCTWSTARPSTVRSTAWDLAAVPGLRRCGSGTRPGRGGAPDATSATLTDSRTSRTAARMAIHTSGQRHRGAVVGDVLGAQPAHGSERTVDRAHDVGDRDLGRGQGQPEAARRPAAALEQAACGAAG